MKKIFFAMPGNKEMAEQICKLVDGEMSEFTLRQFPEQLTGAIDVVSCNTIKHAPNKIDLIQLMVSALT